MDNDTKIKPNKDNDQNKTENTHNYIHKNTHIIFNKDSRSRYFHSITFNTDLDNIYIYIYIYMST